MTNAGINGNKHTAADIEHYGPPVYSNRYQPPLPSGVRYLGDDEWSLPAGASIEPADGDGDDWALTMPDGQSFSLWSEEATVQQP